MSNLRRSGCILSACAVLLLAGACETPPPGVWYQEGKTQADLETARAACRGEAAEEAGPDRPRMQAELRGNIFLRCMRERGWEQVAEGSVPPLPAR